MPEALVDSERILTRLRAEGYQVSQSYDQADVVVVNTCGFVQDAVGHFCCPGKSVFIRRKRPGWFRVFSAF